MRDIIRTFPWKIEMNELRSSGLTLHMQKERIGRLRLAMALDHNGTVDRSFLIDRNHSMGPEIHVVSKNAIIYIMNYARYSQHMENALITVLIARPAQIKRLYEECFLEPDGEIIAAARKYARLKLNR